MIIDRKTRKTAARRPRRWAFTLVELLLVMFIMSVVASLVVGVSWYVIEQGRKSETAVKQKRLIEAIKAYTKVDGTSKLATVVYNPGSARTYERLPSEHMGRLLNLIRTGSLTTTDIDRNNPIYKATSPFLGNDDGQSLVTDAYGNAMIFQRDKGFGGAPRIVSAGPDGIFGFGDQAVTLNAIKCQRDNIYSDN